MSQKKKSDLWKEIVEEAAEPDDGEEELDAAAEAEIEAAANVSVAQAEKELAAAGFDVAAERAKAEAFLATLERGQDPTAPTEDAAPASAAVAQEPAASAPLFIERRRPRPVVFWIGAAAAAAVAGGAIYVALTQPPAPGPIAPSPSPAAPPSTPAPLRNLPPDRVVAADFRRHAAAACDAEEWSVCLADLDEARA